MNFWSTLSKSFTILAPMEDVTDVVFREIIATTARPDVFFSEFTNVEGLCSDGREELLKNFRYTPNQHPIVAQIWGLNPDHFKQAAEIISTLGVDGIDLNLGCPQRHVIKKGACAGMIGNQSAVSAIISAIKKGAPDLPVSIKTRLGFKQIMTEEWVSFLLTLPISALTLHGRTAVQMSNGEANWTEIGKAVKLRDKLNPNIKIIGNGNVKSYDQAINMHRQSGVDGVMIGRGVFDNPWVFSQKAETRKPQDYLNLLIKHLELQSQTYGPTRRYDPMKKFFGMYIQCFPGAKDLRMQLMSTSSCQQALDLLKSQTI